LSKLAKAIVLPPRFPVDPYQMIRRAPDASFKLAARRWVSNSKVSAAGPARRHGHRQGGAVKLRQTFAEAKKIDDVSSRLAQSTIALVVA
jgi:hypothetical protein